MKKLIVIWAILCSITLGCHHSSPKNKSETGSLTNINHTYNRDTLFSVTSLHDTVGILQLFFSPIKIISRKIAYWKPTLDDFFNLPLSDDGLCHSRIDTIIDLKSGSYLVVFRTDSYNEKDKIIECHVCSPVYGLAKFKVENNIYTVLNFKEDLIAAGSFGNGYDTLSVEKFGKDHPLLKFSHGYTGTGTVTNTNTYFELNSLNQVFEYNSYRSEGDSTELDPNYSEEQCYLIHIPSKDSQYRDNIELKCIIKYFDKSKRKIERKQTTEYYRQDNFGNFKIALQ